MRGGAEQAQRDEAAGWDGVTITDSQNLAPDPFVAIALAAAATETLRFGTGVTNAYTRHPAALATVAATVQETSGGRFTLGIGRGDTALFHLGMPPMPVRDFIEHTERLQSYLAGGVVDCGGRPSRIEWLDHARHPKVPLDVAASGPRVIAFGGRVAERVTLGVGADPERVAWAIDLARKAAAGAGRTDGGPALGAYVNVGCHPDPDVGRELIRGSVSAFAHFSAMPGSTGAGLDEDDRAVVAEVGRRYDSRVHLQASAAHNDALRDDFVDRFAIVGPPERCVERIVELAALGLDRFVITWASFGADREVVQTANQLVVDEVLPGLRGS
jgi:5,10-methylenetetrahydromethanopterin reductase